MIRVGAVSRILSSQLKLIQCIQCRSFGVDFKKFTEGNILHELGERKYDQIVDSEYLSDSNKNHLSSASINAVEGSASLIGKPSTLNSVLEHEGVLPNSLEALYLVLHKYCSTNVIAMVDAILLRLLEKYCLLFPKDSRLSDLIERLYGNSKEIEKFKGNFALTEQSHELAEQMLERFIVLKSSSSNSSAKDRHTWKSLNDSHGKFSCAADEVYRLKKSYMEAKEKLYVHRNALKPIQSSYDLVSSLMDLVNTNDRKVLRISDSHEDIGEELNDVQAVTNDAEALVQSLLQQVAEAELKLAEKTAALESWKEQFSQKSEELVGTTPLYVWSTFIRFYAVRGAWKHCMALIELAETQHPLLLTPPEEEEKRVDNEETRMQYSLMYHELIKALCQSNQYEQVLSTLQQMRHLSIPLEASAVTHLLSVFSTTSPSNTFSINASNYAVVGRLLITLNEDIVRCVVKVGDNMPQIDYSKSLSVVEYRALIKTSGYHSTVHLVDRYVNQLIKLNQQYLAEQMVTFLHEKYPMFLTSKVLLPLIRSYKQQGRYADVIKCYSLWSKSIFKRHQENILYHDVFDAVRSQDGLVAKRAAKFLDANNPKVEGLM